MKPAETFSIRDGRTCVFDHVMPDRADAYRVYQMALAKASPYISTQVHEVKSIEELAAQAQFFLDTPGHLWIGAFEVETGRQIADCMARVGLRERMSHVATVGVGVLGAYQGQGLGRALMQRIIDWAIDQPGILKLELSMFDANTPARRLYDSLGFEIEGRRIGSFRQPDGTLHDHLLMGRWLGESS